MRRQRTAAVTRARVTDRYTGPAAPRAVPAVHSLLQLQRTLGNQAVSRLIRSAHGQDVQRYADCTPPRMSGLSCPPRQKGEKETARNGAMVFLPQLTIPVTGETGVLIANFDIGSHAIKSNLASTIYWKQFLRMAPASKRKWRIEGFSDCQGSEKLNTSLRDKRARAVQSILPDAVKRSITSAAGAASPDCITENSTAADRTLNRSVAIILEERTYDFKGDTIEDSLERKEPDTSGCSDTQRKRLAIAFPLARRIGEKAKAAISTMKRGSADEALLKKFFGPRAFEERWHINQGYTAALKALKSDPTYKCVATGTDPCKGGTVGFVGAHAIIFGNPTVVCDSAFNDDDIELADTILHEASHLRDFTNDLQYCSRTTGCTLDTTDEVLPGIGLTDRGALNNADSYSRFASELFRR
jgi:outer membrane protein OmpA-like peptidoglycan-associated protein